MPKISFVRKYKQTNKQTNKQTDRQTFEAQSSSENKPLGPASPGLAAMNQI